MKTVIAIALIALSLGSCKTQEDEELKQLRANLEMAKDKRKESDKRVELFNKAIKLTDRKERKRIIDSLDRLPSVTF